MWRRWHKAGLTGHCMLLVITKTSPSSAPTASIYVFMTHITHTVSVVLNLEQETFFVCLFCFVYSLLQFLTLWFPTPDYAFD